MDCYVKNDVLEELKEKNNYDGDTHLCKIRVADKAAEQN